MSDEGLRRLAELCAFDVVDGPYADGIMTVKKVAGNMCELWNPFHHIEDAFEVVEAMRKRGWNAWTLEYTEINGRPEYWLNAAHPRFGSIHMTGQTEKDVICRAGIMSITAEQNAALAALDAENNERKSDGDM